MKYCFACRHERLQHDSWGCKNGCGCGVSIIYLTPVDFAGAKREDDNEVIEASNELVVEQEKVAESRLRALYMRVIANRAQ